jgi:hypothetical protein
VNFGYFVIEHLAVDAGPIEIDHSEIGNLVGFAMIGHFEIGNSDLVVGLS